MSLISHAGTHIDAPLHFIRGGASIDEMPLDTAVGAARVIEIKDPVVIRPEELKAHHIRRGERVLLKTQNSHKVYRTDEFVEDYVYLSPDAAMYLAEKQVRLVGFDYISIGSPKDEGTIIRTHQALLSHSVWIIEGLNLSEVEEGNYEMMCLPVRLERGDAGLARAIVRRRS
jgi:arylformamidase